MASSSDPIAGPDNVQLLKEESIRNGLVVEYFCAAVGRLHCPAWRVIVKGELGPSETGENTHFHDCKVDGACKGCVVSLHKRDAREGAARDTLRILGVKCSDSSKVRIPTTRE